MGFLLSRAQVLRLEAQEIAASHLKTLVRNMDVCLECPGPTRWPCEPSRWAAGVLQGQLCPPQLGDVVRLGPAGRQWYRVLRVEPCPHLSTWLYLTCYPVTDPAEGDPRCDGARFRLFFCVHDLIPFEG